MKALDINIGGCEKETKMRYTDLKIPPESLFLVTGGAGFIGSNLCEAILSFGYKVRCLDDFSTGKKENIERYHEAGLSDTDIKIFRENLSEAKENIKTWEKLLKKEDDLQVVESVTGGLDASKHTFKYIVQNPQELTKQNEFLYKDLPNMVKLSEKFIEMKKQSVRTEDINRDLDETLLLIKTLSNSISKNYHEILMDDVNVIKHQVDFDK